MDEAGKKISETTQIEDPVVAEPVGSVAPITTADSEKGRSEPNEAFFGTLLLFCLVISLLSATGYFGFAGYRYFKQAQSEKSIPSLDSLPKIEVVAVTPETVPESSEKPEVKPAEAAEKPVVDKKTLVLKVLNGGAVKGVAGTYGEKLKAAGFIKTTIGNSFGDYTGQTLYYAKGQEAGADTIKEEVLKVYPGLVVKEAIAGDKDTAAATYVLILGR